MFVDYCSSCHEITGNNERSAAAPYLKGILGRTAGTGQFRSSEKLRKSGLVWDEKNLFLYLRKSTDVIHGSHHFGIASDEVRRNIVSYLKTL
jgi:cytochrome c